MSKPFLFLDVDGVVNVWPPRVECLPEFQAHGFKINVPACVPESVHQLAEFYDIVWATAWRGCAHGAFREVLRLPETPWSYVDWTEHKLPHIVRYAGERRWAWGDDDAEWELRSLGWTRERHVPDALILAPDTSVGLTQEHVEALLVFAREQETVAR